jgi:sRNA-binding protein
MKVTKHITDLIDILQERCPTAFPKKPLPKVPLAYSQHKAIQRILDVNYATASYILQLWCHGRRYDMACATQGTPRMRCDGVARGVVSSKEAEWHKGRLDAYYEARTAVGSAVSTADLVNTEHYSTVGKGSSILDKLWRALGIKVNIVNTKEETV